jgi:hypothetical protein
MSEPVDTAPGSGGARLVTPGRVVVALCVAVPIVATLWVPSYNKNSPTLGGVPFFYWYQILWVIITGLLMILAYRLVRREQLTRAASAAPTAGNPGNTGGSGDAGAAGAPDGAA